MRAFKKEGNKTSSLKLNTGRKEKLSHTYSYANCLEVSQETAPKITAELNDPLKNLFFFKKCEKEAAQNRISRDGFHQKTILK